MTRELIEKFYRQECSGDERLYITDYFNAHPEELDKYFSEEEWNSFVAPGALSQDISANLLNTIHKSVKKDAGVIRIIKRISVAAGVLIMVGVGWQYFTGRKDQKEYIVVKTVQKITDTVNTSGHTINIVLPDRSVASLSAGSELRYPDPFENEKRIVFLNGEAMFTVMKNPAKPFTVHSAEITTTALGTVFTVTAPGESNTIKVLLQEGKVVIKSADTVHKKLAKDYYLLPGDEFHFNRKTLIAGIVNSEKAKPVAKSRKETTGHSDNANVTNWYMFNNQGLAKVFDQLEAIYNVKIEYNKAAIRGMNFIGKIEKRDSIAFILRDIGIVNNLSVTQQGDTYIITKNNQ